MKKIINFITNAIKYYINQVRIINLKNKGATIGKNVVICKNCKFDNPQKLVIGDNVYIGNNFYSNCIGGLTIGSGTIISYNCTIMTYNHDYKEDLFMPYGLANIYKEVVIKEHVWIGINVNIAGGVVIEKNAVIGMGTTVAKRIEEGNIYAGGRILSKREHKIYKYDLLQVRVMYNPLHYIKFKKIVRRLKRQGIIKFDEIYKVYSNDDYLSLIYRWCENNNYEVDWKNEILKLQKSQK